MSAAKPLRISWSQLRNHTECRQKSYLIRSGKKSSAIDLRNYFHGMVVDRAMRRWLHDEGRQPQQMMTYVDECIDEEQAQAKHTAGGIVRWRNASDRADMRAFCVELCRRLEPLLYELVLPYPFRNGYRFTAPVQIPGPDGSPTVIHLVGEMDLFVVND